MFVAFQEKFVLTDYMHTQPDLNESMRGILIDWMVEVQVTSCNSDHCCHRRDIRLKNMNKMSIKLFGNVFILQYRIVSDFKSSVC